MSETQYIDTVLKWISILDQEWHWKSETMQNEYKHVGSKLKFEVNSSNKIGVSMIFKDGSKPHIDLAWKYLRLVVNGDRMLFWGSKCVYVYIQTFLFLIIHQWWLGFVGLVCIGSSVHCNSL